VKERRVITKTPSVRNLDNFFKLFPSAYLLILVRDGRAVVESRVKTFHESYETSTRIWAEGANTILRFVEKSRGLHANHLIVRYEDLWNEPERELRRIFAFAALDADNYDFSAATRIPVRGSSVFHGKGKEAHWTPVEKTPDFNPVLRSNHWTRSMHERFNWVAGQQQARLGYGIVSYKENEHQLFWGVWNKAMDAKCQFIGLLRSLVASMKNVLKSIFGAETMSKARRTLLGRPLSN
jgi:Sulfotransferase family